MRNKKREFVGGLGKGKQGEGQILAVRDTNRDGPAGDKSFQQRSSLLPSRGKTGAQIPSVMRQPRNPAIAQPN